MSIMVGSFLFLFLEDDGTGLGGMVEDEDYGGSGVFLEGENLKDDHEVASGGEEHDDADPKQ